MKIYAPEIIVERDSVALRSVVDWNGNTREVWYSVAPEWSEYLTRERCDAFLIGLLPVAMSAGEDLHVEGSVSEKLYYSTVHYYTAILKAAIPSLHRIKIFPRQLDAIPLRNEKRGVATGFSGGIDSFCVLADHFCDSVPQGFRLTHLMFNNVGNHGRGEKGRVVCEDRLRRLVPAARAMGLPIVKIDSNLDELYPRSIGFQLTHTLRNVSAIMSMQKLISRYLYASGIKYRDCYVGETYDSAYSDPMAVHLLSTETTECISTGCQYSRVEKTERVSEIALSRECLDICVGGNLGGNCSECWKCMRTVLTLDILGKLHLYDKVFDPAKYRGRMNRYIGQVLSGHDSLSREIRQAAQERGYRFPVPSYCYHLRNIIAAGIRRWAGRCRPSGLVSRLRRIVRGGTGVDEPA